MIGSPCLKYNTQFDNERRRVLVNRLSVFINPGRDRICGFVYNKTCIIYRGRRKAKQNFMSVVSVHMDAVTAHF